VFTNLCGRGSDTSLWWDLIEAYREQEAFTSCRYAGKSDLLLVSRSIWGYSLQGCLRAEQNDNKICEVIVKFQSTCTQMTFTFIHFSVVKGTLMAVRITVCVAKDIVTFAFVDSLLCQRNLKQFR
jgi:hypothetical protein